LRIVRVRLRLRIRVRIVRILKAKG